MDKAIKIAVGTIVLVGMFCLTWHMNKYGHLNKQYHRRYGQWKSPMQVMLGQ